MATTITPSDLSLSISDSIVLNSNSYGGTSSVAIPSCTAADQRVVCVALQSTTESLTWTNLFQYQTTNQQGQGIAAQFEYIRVTNLDNANYILLNIESQTTDNSFTIQLNAGESFILQNGKFLASTTEIRTTYPIPVDVEFVKATANTAKVDVEILTVMKDATYTPEP